MVRQRLGFSLDGWNRGACAVFFLYAPPLWLWPSGVISERFEEYWRLSQDLFARDIPEQFVAFRLVYPILGKVFDLSKPVMLGVPVVFAAASLSVVYLAMLRSTTIAIALMTAVIVASSFQFVNIRFGLPDSITFLAIAISLLKLERLGVFVTTVIGGLNDDRALLALPFIYLWHFKFFTLGETLKTSEAWLLGVCGAFVTVSLIHFILSVGIIGPGIEELSNTK